MNYIALTSANEATMTTAAERLIRASGRGPFPLALMVGIKDAHAASAVYAGGGELWRIGEDNSKPELDPLVDWTIDDSTPDTLATGIDQALNRFLGKKRVAA